MYRLLTYFFVNDTATTEIYTLSLHDALPIYDRREIKLPSFLQYRAGLATHVIASKSTAAIIATASGPNSVRSEEHTSELQSRQYLVCRLLLEKKKEQITHRLTSERHYNR